MNCTGIIFCHKIGQCAVCGMASSSTTAMNQVFVLLPTPSARRLCNVQSVESHHDGGGSHVHCTARVFFQAVVQCAVCGTASSVITVMDHGNGSCTAQIGTGSTSTTQDCTSLVFGQVCGSYSGTLTIVVANTQVSPMRPCHPIRAC